MTEVVACPSCNMQYAVRPELAGKRAKCKCGGRIEFPAITDTLGEADLLDERPAAAAPSRPSADPYGLVGGTKRVVPPPIQAAGSIVCRNCRASLSGGSVVCMNCGMNQQTGSMIRTTVMAAPRPVPQPVSRPTSGTGSNGMGNMLVGGILVVVGLAVTIGTYSAASGGGTYMIFWGPVIFGGIRFFKGLMQMMGGE